ncbi:MAG: hypothetical protein RIR25_1081 [Verrucomicrobiota bacterium]|jgi:hypothetical protein
MPQPIRSTVPYLQGNRAMDGWNTMQGSIMVERGADERQAVDAATRGGLEAIVTNRSPGVIPQALKSPRQTDMPTPDATGEANAPGSPTSPRLRQLVGEINGTGMGSAAPSRPPAVPNARASLDPVIGRLSQAPGGGAAGMQALLQGEQAGRADDRLAASTAIAGAKQNQQLERFTMTALSKGNGSEAQYWAHRAGIQIPQPLLNDANAGRLFGTGSLMATRLYGNDKAGAANFVRSYIQNGGDPIAAFQAAGQPNPAASGARTAGQVVRVQNPDGTIGYATVNRNAPNQAAQPITGADGKPLIGPGAQRGGSGAGAAGGGKASVQQKFEILMKIPGMTEADAAKAAAGQGAKPAQVASTYRAMRQEIANDPRVKPDQVDGAVGAVMADLYGPTWKQMMGGNPGSGAAPPPSAPAPSQAAPALARPVAPAPEIPPLPANLQPGSQYSPSRKMWRDPAGKIYNADGSPA